MTCNPFDVVTLPFPFADRRGSKRRPAVVMSCRALSDHAGQYVLAMITSARHERWPHDLAISDGESAGLRAPSVVRWKLFTLDAAFVHARIGALGAKDRRVLAERMREALLAP